MIEQFHFLHPLWLLALIPLGLLLWLSFKNQTKGSAWEKVIDANLLPLLLQGEDRQTGKLAKWLLAIGWLITTIALADPVWEKVPRPIFQTNTARVLVLDLSSSMMVSDLKPTRLARARFKIEDILSSQFLKDEEGQTGLIVFAGDAFTVSPLTRDVGTIRSLLKVLTPQLLPTQGSRVDLGLKKAHELLKQAGVQNGSVLLIADGVADEALAVAEAKSLRQASHHLSVLGVGTEAGGILPNMRRQDGSNITVKLEIEKLQILAQSGGGNYHTMSSNNADLDQVLKNLVNIKGNTTNVSDTDVIDNILSNDLTSEEWKSLGPALIILLLPLAALAFRKGWLFNIIFAFVLVGMLSHPQQAMAFSFDEQWNKLWQNKEQRAESALQQKQYDKASVLAKSPLRRGSAEYKKGDYEKALESFKSAKGADVRFNEGNTLVNLKHYDEAIKAYEQALKEQPDMQDAKANKKAVKEFLKRRKEQEKQDKKEGKDDQDSKDKKDSEKNKSDKKDGDKSQKKDGEKSDQEKGKGNKNQKQEGEEKSDKKDNQFSDANKKLDDKKEDAKSAEENQEGKKQQEVKKAGEDKEQKAKEEAQAQAELGRKKEQASKLSKEEKMAAEQWLRRIPDDPGGLLRRKFQNQYQRRRIAPRGNMGETQPW